MAGKQGDLFGDDSQARAAAASRLGRWFLGVADGNLLGSAPSVQIDLTASGVIEDEELSSLGGILKEDSNLRRSSESNPAASPEGCVGHEIILPGYK
jgi:hypothetical protein